jgi:hypothetical protein
MNVNREDNYFSIPIIYTRPSIKVKTTESIDRSVMDIMSPWLRGRESSQKWIQPYKIK